MLLAGVPNIIDLNCWRDRRCPCSRNTMLQSYYASCCGNDWSIQKDRSGQRRMRGN